MDKPELEKDEKVVEEFYERMVRRWPLLLGAVVISVLVGVAVVFGGRSIYRHVNNSSPVAKPPKTSQNVASSSSGASKSATSTSNKSPKPSTAQSGANASLPNSGPGQVFEIFAVTSLGAATLHFVISNKRTGARLT